MNHATDWLLLTSFILTAVPVMAAPLPVTLTLDKPGYVTAVIERADGRRVANLASEVRAQAGALTLNWDLYDVGVRKGEKEPYTRTLVEPGTYRVRGLVHDGLDLRYEFSVYSPGQPPWKTADTSGAWMGDHAAPSDCLFLPQGPDGKPGLVLATACSESVHALSFTDLAGRKFKGINSDNFNGAKAVAVDRASAGTGPLRVYFINSVGLCTVNEKDRHEVIFKLTPLKPQPVIDEYGFLDLAIQNGVAVISNSDNRDNIDTTTGNLLVVDIAGKKSLSHLVTGPSRGVAFGADGKLYAVIGRDVVRYGLDAATGSLKEEAKVITGLNEPRRIRFGPGGQMFVSDWGALHQVKVFGVDGKLIRTLGNPGGPQVGKYDEERMDRPDGMTVAPNGELWVAENSHVPKRISIWDTATGKFVRAIYGAAQYGGGGTLDPVDKSIFYYPHGVTPMERATMVFRLDWQTGESRLTHILMRTPLFGRQMAQSWAGFDAKTPASQEHKFNEFDLAFNNRNVPSPHLATTTGGHHYLFNRAYRADQPSHTMIWRWDQATEDRAVPVAIFGSVNSMFSDRGEGKIFDQADFKDGIRAAKEKHADASLFLWSDTNSDQKVQPEEVQFYKGPGGRGSFFGAYLNSDLSFAAGSLGGGLFPPPTIDAKGVPTWELSRVTSLGAVPDAEWSGQFGPPVLGAEFTVVGAGGWEYFNNPQGYRRDGSLAWTYRYYDQWQPAQFPGQLVAGSGSMGRMVRPVKGEAGDIWSTSSEKGAAYLMTADGLFLKTLGGDVRTTPLWRFPEAKRGMSVDGVSWEDECFFPTLNQTADGEIYVVTGKEHISITRLTGLETVRRQYWGTVTVTPAMLAGQPRTVSDVPQKQARKTLEVTLGGTAPVTDAKLDEWPAADAAWAQIDDRTRATLWFTTNRIHAAFRTGDAKLLDNSAADPRFLYKKGGALDLYFGAKWNPGNLQENNPYQEGDCRVLIAKVQGKPTAVLYRPVDPLATKADECVFESPIGREVFASVTDITAAMQFAEDGQGNYEVSLELATVLRTRIGENGKWAPVTAKTLGKQDWHEDKTVILGDLGIIRGNGVQNVQRVCWNSLDTWMTSDIPSEARWRSLNWGVLKLIPGGPVPAVPTK